MFGWSAVRHRCNYDDIQTGKTDRVRLSTSIRLLLSNYLDHECPNAPNDKVDPGNNLRTRST